MDLRGITMPDVRKAVNSLHQKIISERNKKSRWHEDYLDDLRTGRPQKHTNSGLTLVYKAGNVHGDFGILIVTVIAPSGNKPGPMQAEDCKEFDRWTKKTPKPSMLEKLFEGKTAGNVSRRYSAQKARELRALKIAPTPGYTTVVTDKSRKNLPTDIDREPDSAVPLPGSATPGGAGRDIGKFEFNTPGPGSDIKPRTIGQPGEERGHPTLVENNTLSRRTMTATVVLRYLEAFEGVDEVAEAIREAVRTAYKRRWKPGKRRRKQRGKAKMKARQYYRKNRSKIKRKQKVRRRKSSWKRNPARIRSEKLRKKQNRKMIGSQGSPDPRRVVARYENPRVRGGENRKPQRKQKRQDYRKDHIYYMRNRARLKQLARRRYKQKCKPRRNCMNRRKLYREKPEFYNRRPPRYASVLTVPDIGFLIGPKDIMGYVDNISPMTGMVTVRLEGNDTHQLASLPVEVFLRVATLLSDEDMEAFFDLVDVEIGLEAYEDLDEEGLRDCAKWYGADIDSQEFQAFCKSVVGTGDFSSMTPGQVELISEHITGDVGVDGDQLPEEEQEDDRRSLSDASEHDETISPGQDPHLYYGEVEIEKVG
jgi:hypothetical protein